jgi:hypothetical protein
MDPLLLRLGIAGVPCGVLGQTDEIQVFDAAIAERASSTDDPHNFTPIGRKNAVFPGRIIANDSANGAAE